jgi:ADP-heptose:LPS heptosyltransferase
MRILIVNLTRFGDQLQSSPTIAGLKGRHPHAEITVVVDRQHASVCHGIPGIDHVYELDLDQIGRHLLDGGPQLVAAYRYVEDIVRDLRARAFDLAFNFSSSRMSGVFMRLLGVPDSRGWMMDSEGHRLISHPWARLFVASVLNRRYAPYNLVDFYCRIAGVRPPERRLWYIPSGAARERAAALLARAGGEPAEARVIALQPGASNLIRRWPAASFATLGRLLRDRLGARIVLIGSKGESELCAGIAAEIGARAQSVAGHTDLPTLAGVLERTALLVTGDTGPMHLAVAVGTPVVSFFFGPAYVWETGPYAADSIAFQTRIACSPCHHMVRCLAPVCREELEPEMVFWAVRDRLSQDYGALARRARDWPAVDVFRVGFDAEGMYDPMPLVPRLDTAETLRLVYREMWRTVLDGETEPGRAEARLLERWGERGGSASAADMDGPRRGLRTLIELAQRGAGLAAALDAGQSARVAYMEDIGAAIERLDTEIEQLGFVEDGIATLARAFVLEKENLPETQALDVLRREIAALYEALGRRAAFTLRLLASIERPAMGPRVTGSAHAPRHAEAVLLGAAGR